MNDPIKERQKREIEELDKEMEAYTFSNWILHVIFSFVALILLIALSFSLHLLFGFSLVEWFKANY